jgi:hypothetical protein
MITVRATDPFGASDSTTFVVTVNNVSPTAQPFIDWSSANGGVFVVGAPIRVELRNPYDPSLADQTAGFRYSFDFDGDGTFNGPGEANLTSPVAYFTFTTPGTHRILVRITDKDGGFTDYWQDILVGGPSGENG